MTSKVTAIANLEKLDGRGKEIADWVEHVLVPQKNSAPKNIAPDQTVLGLHGIPYPPSLFQLRVLTALADIAPNQRIENAGAVIWNAINWGQEYDSGTAWMSVPWRLTQPLTNSSVQACTLGQLLLACERHHLLVSIMPFNRKAMTFFFNNTDGIKGKRRLMTLDELREQISGGDLS